MDTCKEMGPRQGQGRISMLIIVLAIHCLARQGVQALPIPTIDQPTPSSCNDPYHCRTTWNIVWSCWVTIFACTWVAVHPNIPDPHDKWFMIALRRLQLVVMALIAPELLVVWAMRQWLAARRIAKEHQSVFISSYKFKAADVRLL